jgi:hypothetical protein
MEDFILLPFHHGSESLNLMLPRRGGNRPARRQRVNGVALTHGGAPVQPEGNRQNNRAGNPRAHNNKDKNNDTPNITHICEMNQIEIVNGEYPNSMIYYHNVFTCTYR